MAKPFPGWFITSTKISNVLTSPSAKYVPIDDELLESENLEIIGEDPENGSLRTEAIPMRILTEFSVFNIETRQLVTLHSLFVPRDSPELSSYCAVGYVFPIMEDEVEDSDTILDPDLEDCQYLRLSTIRTMSLLDFDEEHGILDRYSL